MIPRSAFAPCDQCLLSPLNPNQWLGLSDAIAEGPVLSFKSVLRFRGMSVSFLKWRLYDARNPRADAFLNCFLLLPRTWVFQFAGFIVMPQGVAQFLI